MVKNNHVLFGVDIVTPEKEGIVQTFSWDILKQIQIPDTIIHLAGKAHDLKNSVAKQEYFDINVGLTRQIFDYFLESEAKKFIFFSSVKAAADSVQGEFLTEDVIPNPVGPYGESKFQAEKYILSKQEEFDAKGKQVYILRPCMIHGPGNKGNLNLLYSMVSKGLPWPLGLFDNQKSFCSIDNIAFVVEQLIRNENVPGGIYHVCDDETLSTNEVIQLICQSLNKNPRIWNLPKGWIYSMARMGDLMHLPLNKERLNKLTENYRVSNSKIKNALGIEKMPVSARDGMIKTLKSFQSISTT